MTSWRFSLGDNRDGVTVLSAEYPIEPCAAIAGGTIPTPHSIAVAGGLVHCSRCGTRFGYASVSNLAPSDTKAGG